MLDALLEREMALLKEIERHKLLLAALHGQLSECRLWKDRTAMAQLAEAQKETPNGSTGEGIDVDAHSSGRQD